MPGDDEHPVRLTNRGARRLATATKARERRYRNVENRVVPNPTHQRSLPAYACFALTPSGGIPAAASTFVPGSAVCAMYVHDPTTSHIVTGGWSEPVFNHGTASIAAGTLVGVIYRGGYPYVDVVVC